MPVKRGHTLMCGRCGTSFRTLGRNARWCRSCAPLVIAEGKARKRGMNGQNNIKLLPDHARTMRRQSVFSHSDVLHAPVEKSLKMFTAILNGTATMAGI